MYMYCIMTCICTYTEVQYVQKVLSKNYTKKIYKTGFLGLFISKNGGKTFIKHVIHAPWGK